MAKRKLLISTKKDFEEGEIYFKWEQSRIDNNKNIISVTTGGTGSGKSTFDLRRAEISHRKRFNESFPVDKNCCFSIAELMRRISSGNLRKGEVLILEEAGFNAGSQDWMNKTTKMFNYLLQTFRSMNVCLYMNLPVLSMLAKQARQLVHIHFETNGIDFERKVNKIKPLVHQLNQQSGKSYWKYLRIRHRSKVRPVQRMLFGVPDQEILNSYENKKNKFLIDMTTEFANKLAKEDRDKLDKLTRQDLTDIQKFTLEELRKGTSQKDIGKLRGVTIQTVNTCVKYLVKKGYETNSLGKSLKSVVKAPLSAL